MARQQKEEDLIFYEKTLLFTMLCGVGYNLALGLLFVPFFFLSADLFVKQAALVGLAVTVAALWVDYKVAAHLNYYRTEASPMWVALTRCVDISRWIIFICLLFSIS